MGTADHNRHFSGMFPRGQLSGQDEPYNSELLPLSPKRQDLQKRSQSPNGGQSLYRKLSKEAKEKYDRPSDATSATKADLASPEEHRSSHCQGASGIMENAKPRALEKIQNDEEKEKSEDQEGEQGSGNIVEHILKELKGINKIQEEISDLRQYLSSVRGSVDEVSCCVDAVLSEIGELYSGASAAPHPSPVSQPPRIRRGSLGRQDAITSPHNPSPLLDHKDFGNDLGCMTSHRSPKQWQVDQATLRLVQQTDSEQNLNMHMLSHANPDLCYLELHSGRNYQSTSSLSSCHSSNCLDGGFLSGDTEYERWSSADIQHSISREGGWSEEDVSSFANSREELQNYLRVWNRCATEETQSSTPGHSSHNSSEHLSLLFGRHYNSPSHSSNMAEWRPPRNETEEENLECDCAADCPFSRSSGYHTMEACANELGSGPSRSLSCSTVLLTDCDDGNLEPHSPCDDCPSSGDTLDLGSVESLDREWTDHSVSREDAEESLSKESSEMDSESAPKNSNVGFDVTTFSKAVLTFRSALKGALKKLEGSNPEDVEDNSGTEPSLSLVRQTSKPKEEQGSQEYSEEEASLIENQTQFATPKEESDNSVYMDCETHETLSDSLQTSSHEETCSPCTPTEHHSLQISQGKVEYPTHVELSSLDHSPARRAESPLAPMSSADESRLSPIRENHVLDQTNQEKPTDASHKERIANFQRILREKRQTRHRLSRSTQGSVGSHGSQGSQGSQSQDEFIPGIY